ncbi:hypothetical protein J6590_012485 [Homalodisca vitripennis]|nr:hypothetical protein J6590_012485 [Homalodisca vitripennis]
MTKGHRVKAAFFHKKYSELVKASLSSMDTPPSLVAVIDSEDPQMNAIITSEEECVTYKVLNPEEHVSIILFSSGTTGEPKGIQMSDTAITLMGVLFAPHVKTLFNASPFYWYTGVMTFISPILNSYTVVMSNATETRENVKLVQKYQADGWFLSIGAMIQCTHLENIESYDCSSIKEVYAGGEVMLKSVMEAFLAKVVGGPAMVQVMYGITEGGIMATTNSDDEALLETSLQPGLFLHLSPGVEMKILDDDRKPVAPGSLGEVWFKCPGMTPGYWSLPEVNRQVFDKDGFFCSGDAGFRNHRGYLLHRGRVSDLITYKGVKVAPAEVEEVLMSHPAVLDAVVIGKAHSTDTQHVTAFVVRRPGSQATGEEIAAFVHNQVDDMRKLRGGVHFVESLPRIAVGKVIRKRWQRTTEKCPVIVFTQWVQNSPVDGLSVLCRPLSCNVTLERTGCQNVSSSLPGEHFRPPAVGGGSAEQWRRPCNAAAGLQSAGISAGDYIVLCCDKSILSYSLLLGVMFTGATAVLFPPDSLFCTQVEGQTGKTATFADILQQSTATAAGLQSAGITAGDYVVLCCDKSILSYSLLLGIMFTGTTAVLFPPDSLFCTQVQGQTGNTATFADILQQSTATAAGLQSAGISAGDYIVLCCDKSILSYSLLLGVMFTGTTAVLFPPDSLFCTQVEGQTGKTATFADILQQSTATAAGLQSAGISAGDYIVLCCDKSILSYSLLLSIMFTGATAVLCPPDKADMIDRLTRGHTVKVILYDSVYSASVRISLDKMDPAPLLCATTDLEDLRAVGLLGASQDYKVHEVSDIHRHVSIIMFSSGTTGEPKGIQVTDVAIQLAGFEVHEVSGTHRHVSISMFCSGNTRKHKDIQVTDVAIQLAGFDQVCRVHEVSDTHRDVSIIMSRSGTTGEPKGIQGTRGVGHPPARVHHHVPVELPENPRGYKSLTLLFSCLDLSKFSSVPAKSAGYTRCRTPTVTCPSSCPVVELPENPRGYNQVCRVHEVSDTHRDVSIIMSRSGTTGEPKRIQSKFSSVPAKSVGYTRCRTPTGTCPSSCCPVKLPENPRGYKSLTFLFSCLDKSKFSSVPSKSVGYTRCRTPTGTCPSSCPVVELPENPRGYKSLTFLFSCLDKSKFSSVPSKSVGYTRCRTPTGTYHVVQWNYRRTQGDTILLSTSQVCRVHEVSDTHQNVSIIMSRSGTTGEPKRIQVTDVAI